MNKPIPSFHSSVTADAPRLIEAGFPCHQVGAETTRERDTGQSPPTHRLHVWWARRPLTPSRAAILASLLPADADPEAFIRRLGIERRQVVIHGVAWTLTGKLLERIEGGRLVVDGVVLRALEKEQARRRQNLGLIARLRQAHPELTGDPVLKRWEAESRPIPEPWPQEGEVLEVVRVMGDPAWAKAKMAFTQSVGVRFPGDAYGYARAFASPIPYEPSDLTVLDPTSGGGSIPFEALRLGHKVIANELNPVATTILHATLDYPARFGLDLKPDIQRFGNQLLRLLEVQLAGCFGDGGPVPNTEFQQLEKFLGQENQTFLEQFNQESILDYIHCRQITCPHCGGEAPLLNTFWLSKEAGDRWGVKVIPENGKVCFATYRVGANGRGPNGEDPNGCTVHCGVGQCVHCRQAIDGDEIKRQARGESSHGKWQDRLYAVVAQRLEPELDAEGRPRRYASGPRKGEIRTCKVRYFRPPNDRDLKALAEAERRLQAKWPEWEREGLIPKEEIPPGHRRDQRDGLVNYGITHWLDMFTPRQLLGHLTLIDGLRRLTPEILEELGEEKGRAVITYLQFAIDKGLDYNSKHTRWEFTRGVVKGTFGRHDFSLKWTFGEMVFTGPNSGAAWGLSQVLDAYEGIAKLLEPVQRATGGNPPVTVRHGTAAWLEGVADNSVNLVCMDPPYYNNVQYAELSDFFYVWQRRTLRNLYPQIYSRRLTEKKVEAVANPFRHGDPLGAKKTYERIMGEIFSECRRVLKDDGLMTLMFTHKSQDAWETLTRSLMESGWIITACWPIESEGEYSTHQMEVAAAASSIFLTCRKRPEGVREPALWESAFGQTGVRQQIEAAVQAGMKQFAPLRLNPVDEMVACYGKALEVLSAHWPVVDGDGPVSPIQAMNEASRVVAQARVAQLTDGRLQVADLDSETALALTVYGIWEYGEFPYDEALNLSRSLGIALEGKPAGYQVRDRMAGINPATDGRQRNQDGYFAPLVRKGAKLRLALPEERAEARIDHPQTDWDRLCGLILAFREGDVPVARAYLAKHAEGNQTRILDLLEVWGDEARDPERRREARALLFGLGRSER